MSKRKAAKASKHDRRPKIVARAQRTKQAVVRSPKDNNPPQDSPAPVAPLRSVAAVPTDSPFELHDGSKQLHDGSKQEAPIVENRAAPLQDDFNRLMRDHASRKAFDVSSAAANMQAYQGTLLEMAQANMQFALEFAQRLATVRSPFEAVGVLAEFTGRRIDMLRKYSKEIAELSTKPLIA